MMNNEIPKWWAMKFKEGEKEVMEHWFYNSLNSVAVGPLKVQAKLWMVVKDVILTWT